MQNIYIQPRIESYNSYRKFADRNGFSFEILDFASPQVLNDIDELNYRREFYQYHLSDFNQNISLHGAFIDMLVHSPDKAIRQASQHKVRLCMETALQLGAGSIVFHTGFNPILRNPRYLPNWLAASSEFWRQMSEEYNIEILLENMWDNNPCVLAELMQELSDANVNLCFDTGHHNVFSNCTYNDWFALVGNRITYMHFNDNNGKLDEELPPGQGNIDWQKLSGMLVNLGHKPRVVLEVANLEAIEAAISYLKNNTIFPWN